MFPWQGRRPDVAFGSGTQATSPTAEGATLLSDTDISRRYHAAVAQNERLLADGEAEHRRCEGNTLVPGRHKWVIMCYNATCWCLLLPAWRTMNPEPKGNPLLFLGVTPKMVGVARCPSGFPSTPNPQKTGYQLQKRHPINAEVGVRAQPGGAPQPQPCAGLGQRREVLAAGARAPAGPGPWGPWPGVDEAP